MGTNLVVPQIETPLVTLETAEGRIGQEPVEASDAGEYEAKFLATSQLLQSEIEKSARLEKQLALARVELGQYGSDLRMWVSAHASEYPARRARELQARMNEIEAVK